MWCSSQCAACGVISLAVKRRHLLDLALVVGQVELHGRYFMVGMTKLLSVTAAALSIAGQRCVTVFTRV